MWNILVQILHIDSQLIAKKKFYLRELKRTLLYVLIVKLTIWEMFRE